ncbi:Ribonuclease D [Thermogutta terrifontis]|uniref:Ribonuclease D n=1 Tax=Thermogutta terrifontis TaxID=1331910 RepID=A0A286RIA8_9BACT|nr:HRDC domain-containing protein [Thermogutta terrifontis]ASV75676.1 Ribonuclease D [Thermogutta terrifontis]
MNRESATGGEDRHPVRRIAAVNDFEIFCRELRERPRLALDTEFVAEDSYQPNLCLIQVAFDDELVVIDPFPLGSVRRFWEAIVEGNVEVVVHAGRVDLQFCYNAIGRFPDRVFDVQIAAGLTGLEYPAGLANILQKYLGISVTKHETRTDWRRRPLSDRQIEYALNDVRYLLPLRDRLEGELIRLNRLEWLKEEVQRQQQMAIQAEGEERWRRLTGYGGVSRRELAILRELWHWREQEAARRNVPPRRVLRDDLLVELARRASGDPKRILAIRGMSHHAVRHLVPMISACIRQAIALPPEKWPQLPNRPGVQQSPVVGQFLYSALASLCLKKQIAVGLVGGTNDLRDWLAYYLSGSTDDSPPILAQGWRRELIGDTLQMLVTGRAALRIADPTADNPLELVFLPQPEVKSREMADRPSDAQLTEGSDDVTASSHGESCGTVA